MTGQELIQSNLELATKLQETTAVANTAVNSVNKITEHIVPKVYLKEEALLDKVRLYLEGKGSWVKYVIGALMFAITAFTGVGVAEVLNVIDDGYQIITGLLTGGLTTTALLGGILGGKAKRFNPKENIQEINVQTGEIKLK